MKLLHTSDWHLGRTLYGKQRYIEFEKFLNWLLETIKIENIDILLVAGDIFDTATPGTKSQELYYRFLYNIAGTGCRNVIITSGNHDSPTFLSAPRDILKFLNISIVVSTDNPEDEVIEIFDKNNNLQAIVCAVPYLRDKDIRTVESGENIDDKALNLVTAITEHYSVVCDLAKNKSKDGVPIIAMGHMFVTGGKTLSDDGVRELYVGNLAHIGIEVFPSYIDYVALGHLHVPQKVGGSDFVRFSGSPIPMGFGEANQKKSVIVVSFSDGNKEVRPIYVPCFQTLNRIVGDRETILSKILELKEENSDSWLEIEYKGLEINPMLQSDIEEAIKGSSLEVRVIKNRLITNKALESLDSIEELDDLTPLEVFNRCLNAYDVTETERPLLKNLYGEILTSIEEGYSED